jgi:mannose/cellobiose epimerase-like protein (N-acyl-D-glucosamine 2-epimerase family)
LDGVAVVATQDATFVAPLDRSQDVRKIVARLEQAGRVEARLPSERAHDMTTAGWRGRARGWLFDEALPLWSTAGVDERCGGFHEALGFDARPIARPKRVRTMARQIYAFAMAAAHGWNGQADALVAHGIEFIAHNGRTTRGGWAHALHAQGGVADPAEDCYDHACVLLALAHASRCGHRVADSLARETLAFMDAHLADWRRGGFHETTGAYTSRRSNSHMHLLEAFLAWHETTGDDDYLRRAALIVSLFTEHFFDPDSWTLGEYFGPRWRPAVGASGEWTEPGHQFEWAALLLDFAARTGRRDVTAFARKLYASAVANGLNRATGLAHGAVSRHGEPLDLVSRSWPQAEAVKAAIALDAAGGPDLKPEIEERVARLFRRHLDPAPSGLWIDRVDENGRACATEVPASILYHVVDALACYLDAGAGQARPVAQPTSLRMKS